MNLRESSLKRIVQLMKDPQRGVAIKDRTFHFHVFTDCFVGHEFVTWALNNALVNTRDHATMLGQDLLDRGIIYHASNDQPFRDGYFFYTFQKFPEIPDSEMDVIVMRMKAHPTGVSIQDRSHHLRNYRDCFVGSEAVTWFVNNVPKHAPNRSTAVKLGQELMNKGIVHSPNQQPFVDSPDYYFFQKPIHAGYLGKLDKNGSEWKTRWFAIKDAKEKKLWYFNSPRDPVPRDFIPLVDACIRVVLDQDVAYFEICTSLRVFTLRPTSSTLLARWIACLSEYIGAEGFENNIRMEKADRSIAVQECRVSAKMLKDHRLVALGPSILEAVGGSLSEDVDDGDQKDNHDSLKLYENGSPLRYLETFEKPGNLGALANLGTLEPKENHDDSENVDVVEPLNLMNDDDLDIDIEDELPASETNTSTTLDTQYEYGLMGEANYLPPSANITPRPQLTTDTLQHSHEYARESMSSDEEEILERIKQQLLLTAAQDSTFASSTQDFFPSTFNTLPTNSSENSLNNFHLL